MIVDALEDVSQIGLRTEVVELCGLDDRHGSGKGLGTAIGPGKKPVFAAYANRPQGAFGWIVVDCPRGHPQGTSRTAPDGSQA